MVSFSQLAADHLAFRVKWGRLIITVTTSQLPDFIGEDVDSERMIGSNSSKLLLHGMAYCLTHYQPEYVVPAQYMGFHPIVSSRVKIGFQWQLRSSTPICRGVLCL